MDLYGMGQMVGYITHNKKSQGIQMLVHISSIHM